MEENVNTEFMGAPQPTEEGLPPEGEVTTPPEGNADSSFVEVKFNKELKRLSLTEAAELAQKGMKFDMIAADLDRLKRLSSSEGLSVGEYLSRIETERSERLLGELTEKCSGDRELAEKLLRAEGEQTAPEKDAELRREFPDLSADSLPEEVKTAAKLKGTGLLFEYLLYEHHKRLAAAEETARSQRAAESGLGSLSSEPARSAADTEFLKGVWGR